MKYASLSIIAAFIFLLQAQPVFAINELQSPEFKLRLSTCGDGQSELNQCANEAFQDADRELNSVYGEVIKGMEAYGQEDIKLLKDAQRAWIPFRDKSCEFEDGFEEYRGSSTPFKNLQCMEYFTRQRLDDFRRYTDCGEVGCR